MGVRTILAAAALLLAGTGAQAAYDRLYVFGDSLVDSGNAASQVPGVAGPNGRFTNGLNFADDLSITLGFGEATAFRNGGINYSVGGATVAPFAGQSSPDLGSQITDYYEPSVRPIQLPGGITLPAPRPKIDANSLVLVTAGGNDVRDYARFGVPTPTDTVADLRLDLQRLIADGARNIVVVGLPDIGLIPSVYGTATQGAATQLSQQLNLAFNGIVQSFRASLGNTGSIQLFDLYTLQHDVTDNPLTFGLDPTLIHQDCTSGNALPACTGYAYWDGIHPTAQLHSLIASRISALVPEPSSWATMVAGFLVVGAALRRTRGGELSARRA